MEDYTTGGKRLLDPTKVWREKINSRIIRVYEHIYA